MSAKRASCLWEIPTADYSISLNASSQLNALGATIYHLIAGEAPPNAQDRLAAVVANESDLYVPIGKSAKGYEEQFMAAIDMALQIFQKDRPQTADIV